MLNFCTLFNSNYFSRGLTLYKSLIDNCSAFHLYVFAFDENTYKTLKELSLERITVISLNDFENDKLLEVKKGRTAAEYCWTCTPSTILYVIEKYKVDNCTYLDADMVFYNDPGILLDELDGKSVMITPHRYNKNHMYFAELSGIYCVQFVYFKNSPEALEVLRWWVKACIEWCYARFEDGKFGDQKYLDNWPQMFPCVKVLEHNGGGVAPWNQVDFKIVIKENILFVKCINTDKLYELVFFHFHGVKMLDNGYIILSDTYKIRKDFFEIIYKNYVYSLVGNIEKISPEITFEPHGISTQALNLRFFLRFWKRRMLKLNNFMKMKKRDKWPI